ncbi:hypothetical protein [Nonomuraea sp. NPDC005650]|uniref:hypothetical protein n=1 Tax=Nonomuraea sp. NPDC005650 TaxID=3157045 RepID=UPI0033B6EBC5
MASVQPESTGIGVVGFSEVVLAYSMADVQDDVHQELMWDLRALAAVGQITDEWVAQTGVPVPLQKSSQGA